MHKKESQAQLVARLAEATQQVTVGACYMHYKQLCYKVLAVALREADNEPCVVYQAEYGAKATWIRPLTNWLETVEVGGKRIPRFSKVASAANSPDGRVHAIYLNGLGSGEIRRRETAVIRYLAKRGIDVSAAQIDWYSHKPFGELFDRLVQLAKAELRKHDKLVLIGSSAGGSMAVNVLGELNDKRVTAITLCSRLRLAKLPWWDNRSLALMAHLGSDRPSRAFYDSVMYCNDVTIPRLTPSSKKQIVIVQQWADFVVPRATMSIPGVRVYKVPALGHGWGIAKGVLELPRILG